MLSNKAKRNVWLTLAILAAICTIDRAIRVVAGTIDWTSLVCAIIITAFCIRFYLNCRKQAENAE